MRPFFTRPVSAADEVSADLEAHLEMTTRALLDQGMTPTQARAEAERRFGDIVTIRAECERYAAERAHHEQRAELHAELKQDVAFSVRQLLRARGFTTIAVLTLALGFGATVAVFSALYAVALRPLPFAHAERVVKLINTRKGEADGASAPDFLAIRDNTRGAFEHVAATVLGTGFTLRGNGQEGGTPELVGGGRVSADFFRVFGVAALLGRTFRQDEDIPGSDNVVVLSHRAWVNRFAEDRAIVGKTIRMDGAPRTVIGVMPASFDLTRDSEELWVPLAITPEAAAKHAAKFLELVARLKPGISETQAASAATAAKRAMAATDPNLRVPVNELSVITRRFIDDFVGDYRSLLVILLGAVGFVLLIACTNVANLLLARGTARSRELSIRAALGAGRGRLIRQLLTESLILSTIGAFAGLALAFGLLRALLSVSPAGVPRLEQARIDLPVLAFTVALAVVATVVFGLFPALRAAGTQLERALREGGRSIRGGHDRVRTLLVSLEVAMAMTLLVGAGLLIRSAWLVQHVHPGFEPRGVLTGRLMLPAAQYADVPAITTFYERLHREASRAPGVRVAALVSVVPLSGNSMGASVLSEDQSSDETRPLVANLRLATSGYLDAMRIPLLAGRDLSDRDNASSPNVVVVNEALAAKLWPNVTPRDLIGKRISGLSPSRTEPHWMEIVGVAGNLHDDALSSPEKPEFYAPVAQAPAMIWPLIQRSLVLVMRARNEAAPAEALTKTFRSSIAAVDPSLPVADLRSMEDFLRSSRATSRFNTLLLATLGGIALVLAMVGVYGVVSYFVNQRRQEIAVRIALGATPATVLRYVTMRGLRPLVGGLVFGGVLAIVAARVLQSQLYRVAPSDPVTIVGTALLLLGVALAATLVPARRATRVAPIIALTE